jgi:imidazolonepropionase-like amidohydrolase
MRTLVRDVRVFDGLETVPRAQVVIDGDRIAEYGGDRVELEIDGSGKTLLPGLIDAHTHNA